MITLIPALFPPYWVWLPDWILACLIIRYHCYNHQFPPFEVAGRPPKCHSLFAWPCSHKPPGQPVDCETEAGDLPFLFSFQHFANFTSGLLPIKMSSSKKPTQTLQLSDSFTLHKNGKSSLYGYVSCKNQYWRDGPDNLDQSSIDHMLWFFSHLYHFIHLW